MDEEPSTGVYREVSQEKPVKKFSKLKLIIILIIAIVVVSSILLISNYLKKGEEEIRWCIDNTETYWECKAFQELSRDYCKETFSKMDASVNDIEKERNQCYFYVEMFRALKEKNLDICYQIAEMDGYEKWGAWTAIKCFVLVSDSKEDCKLAKDFPDSEEYPGEKEEFCNVFFEFLEDDNFEQSETFKELDDDSKYLLYILKATKTQSIADCHKIPLDIRKPDKPRQEHRRMYCKLWAGYPEAQKEDFCEPLLDHCYDQKLL